MTSVTFVALFFCRYHFERFDENKYFSRPISQNTQLVILPALPLIISVRLSYKTFKKISYEIPHFINGIKKTEMAGNSRQTCRSGKRNCFCYRIHQGNRKRESL